MSMEITLDRIDRVYHPGVSLHFLFSSVLTSWLTGEGAWRRGGDIKWLHEPLGYASSLETCR